MMLVRKVMNGCEKPAFHRIDRRFNESRMKRIDFREEESDDKSKWTFT